MRPFVSIIFKAESCVGLYVVKCARKGPIKRREADDEGYAIEHIILVDFQCFTTASGTCSILLGGNRLMRLRLVATGSFSDRAAMKEG